MLPNVEFSLEELQQTANVLAKKYDIGIDQIKLFMGTRGC